MKNPSLWCKIKHFSFDDRDAEFCFSDRPARENNWSKRFAVKVNHEYRQISYLTMVSDHGITANVVSDHARHLRLLHMPQNRRNRCDQLDQRLHHGLTKCGKSVVSRYWQNCENTIASYCGSGGS